jgi:hypothetical protein
MLVLAERRRGLELSCASGRGRPSKSPLYKGSVPMKERHARADWAAAAAAN